MSINNSPDISELTPQKSHEQRKCQCQIQLQNNNDGKQ